MTRDAIILALVRLALAICAAAALYARWRHEHPLGIGPLRGVARAFAVGSLIGGASMIATVGLIFATGTASVRGVSINLPLLGAGLAVFVVAGVLEEIVYRALFLTGLIRLTGRPLLALAISSAVFGIVHLTGSSHATAIGIVSNVAGGLMYGIAFLATRRVWLPAGAHFAWNFVQASVFGFPTSENTDFSGAILQVVIGQPDWLSGGAYGPEGSIFSLPGRVLVIGLVLAAAYRLRPAVGADKRATQIAGSVRSAPFS